MIVTLTKIAVNQKNIYFGLDLNVSKCHVNMRSPKGGRRRCKGPGRRPGGREEVQENWEACPSTQEGRRRCRRAGKAAPAPRRAGGGAGELGDPGGSR